jgi:hypothetical protein
MSSKKTNQHDATYGQGLLRTRGGWTLREMLGADYDRLRSDGKTLFTQRPSGDSGETESQSVPNSNSKEQK